MQVIAANVPLIEPPEWAILERQLIALMNQAVDPVVARYIKEDGSVMWPPADDHTGVDALDDAYESFFSWPLFYLLGGDDKFLQLAQREFDAVTRQYARYATGFGHPMVVKEYEQGYDWFHQGEGYLFFYLLNLAAPTNQRNQERSRRFAGFFVNEDSDALNYDPEHQLMKCSLIGSMGPGHQLFAGADFGYRPYMEYYGLAFQDIEGIDSLEDLHDPAKAARFLAVVQQRWAYGDAVMNLAVTSMIANAYLHTAEEKYRQFVQDYVGAWIERAQQNGGIVPDNVGLTGQIGEYFNGKWYGSRYGWTFPHGWSSVGAGVVVASENAMLLCQDAGWLEFARSQIDILMSQGIMHEGTLHVPHKYGDRGNYTYTLWIADVLFEDGTVSLGEDNLAEGESLSKNTVLWQDGWFEFYPMDPKFMTHVWYLSMDAGDKTRLKQLRNHRRRDWEHVIFEPHSKKDLGGNDQAWVAFLDGEFPDYPEQILQHNLAQVYHRLDFMGQDRQDPRTYGDAYLQLRNPISLEGLIQLTMGGPRPIYNGGLLMVRVRYYDGDRRRPGLPEDVAALVTAVEADRTVLELVNLSAAQERSVIVQAGGFGEHQFTEVHYAVRQSGETVSPHYQGRVAPRTVEHSRTVNGQWFEVRLQPASQITLDIGTKRFVHDPSYAEPW